jgi:hypothetical protein
MQTDMNRREPPGFLSLLVIGIATVFFVNSCQQVRQLDLVEKCFEKTNSPLCMVGRR